MDELFTEPLHKPRKRRFNGDQSVDAQGQLVEYDHGYLRQKIKAERGVLPKKTPKKPAFEPQIVSDCGIELLYVCELGTLPAVIQDILTVEVWWRPAGKPGPLQPVAVSTETTVPTVADQALLKYLMPFRESRPGSRGNRFLVPLPSQIKLCELFSDAAQLRWSARNSEPGWKLHKMEFSGKCPWSVAWESNEDGLSRPIVTLNTFHGDFPLPEWQAFSPAGWIIAGNALHLISIRSAASQLIPLFGAPMPWMNRTQKEAFGEAIALDGNADLTAIPQEERCQEVDVLPTGNLYVTPARYKHLGQEQLQCKLSFDYAGTLCDENSPEMRLNGVHRIILRSPEAEERLKAELRQLGFRNVTRTGGDEDPGWKLLPSQLDGAVRTLVLTGWQINAQGKNYCRPVDKSFGITASGIDWLELSATLDFGDGRQIELPEILKAAKKGQKAVRLDDGTYGILPQEWLEKFTVLLEIGESDDDKVRFRQQQAAILQAILAEQLQDLDGKYHSLLQQWETMDNAQTETVSPPDWFTATLRPYQLQALQWLTAMERKGLSGILADDMGLGKTVEVLSLLARRHEDAPQAPSLVVMPSSLLFNWSAEAAKFAPHLRTAFYYGSNRDASPEWFRQYDVLFTTYGTLRQDVIRLSRIPFDYVILDESQAIKNAESATAQATRSLKAQHRLAMTGTPVENHLAELFSQLSFLNPGLFSQRFTTAIAKENTILHDAQTARRLRKAVAPFLLRRRKEQVATDLPPKTEQILWCELDEIQRFHYNQLRDFYRKELSGTAGNAPGATANMLGALLRLRQAACHAGLINESCRANASAKLDILHAHLSALLESGHKALVFSQFTTLLKLAARDLDAAGWKYCYLDGETKDRGEVVRQFQEMPEIGVFLISLKAGGVGLNLTAADYVYLLDPWWNPAAEAQAIDRTYRIGQTRPVFAYRMIARDTVEEKVLQMQRRKQQIAAAALGRTAPGASPLELPPELTADDLKELLADGLEE